MPPLRELPLRATKRALRVARRQVAVLRSRRQHGSTRDAAASAPPVRPPRPSPGATAREPTPPARERPAVAPSSGVDEPAHVSEEPVLVAQLADAEAEDGPGAELRIDEPWEGYGQMNVRNVVARLDSLTAEELAVVKLFESTHRRRKTVIGAVDRQLKSAARRAASNT